MQARRGAAGVSHKAAHAFGSVPPPTAVLGFTPQVGQAKAKDYGAPWAAAAAAHASHGDKMQASPTPVTSRPDLTPPATGNLFGGVPFASDTLEQQSPALGEPSFAPLPFTAPPKKPVGLFSDLASQPAAFSGFGASTSFSAASQPKAAGASSKPTASDALPASKASASADAGPALKPAVTPSFPTAPPSTFSKQPSPLNQQSVFKIGSGAPKQQPAFQFGSNASAAGAELQTPQHLAPQEEPMIEVGKDKDQGGAARFGREASVSSDASGDTAVDEQLYTFSSQRSAQDKLLGLVDANHQAADDTEGLYSFGQAARSWADRNKAEPLESQQETAPVTPLQVLPQLPDDTFSLSFY